jgi:hypothetical protein
VLYCYRITNRDDINHQSNSDKLNQQNNNPKPRLKANKTHFYPADQETLRIKLSELREKEIKLPILVFRFDHLGYLAFFHSSN